MTRPDFMLHIHRLNLLLPKEQRCVFSKWRVPWNYVFSPFKNLYLTVRFINNWICWKDCSFGSVRKRSVELSKYEFEYIKAEQTIIKIKFIFLSIYLFWIFFQCLKICINLWGKLWFPSPWNTIKISSQRLGSVSRSWGTILLSQARKEQNRTT